MGEVRTWAVVAGGGTAGHALPAVALGRALVARGHDRASIHFVGSRRGIEARLVPDAGFAITLLPGRGVPRRFGIEPVLAMAGLGVALVRAVALLARRRPAVVVSFPRRWPQCCCACLWWWPSRTPCPAR